MKGSVHMTDIEKKTEEVLEQEVSKDELNAVTGGYACRKSSGTDKSNDEKASSCFFGVLNPLNL